MLDFSLPPHYTFNRQKFFSQTTKAHWGNWQWQLDNLINQNTIGIEDCFTVDEKLNKFPFGLTPYFFSLINFDDIHDPILRQMAPDSLELVSKEFISEDPFNEESTSPLPGVIKRFPDRIVLTVSNRCAGYCRFCTRKWNWQKNFVLSRDLKKLVEYLESNSQIREVIISGGDPLLLCDSAIDELLATISSVQSIEVIRIGTRILSFLPYRITDSLVASLRKYKPLWIMTHFNHSNEINEVTVEAINRLIRGGVVLNNQTVLLRGVNDNTAILSELFRKLINNRIKPYYLFQCDPVMGVEHFVVDEADGIQIMHELQQSLSGLAIPKYVRDTPGIGKVQII